MADASRPLRVCYVIWSLGLGGAEQIVIRLATGLDRRRFEPLVVCLNEPGPFADHVTRQGIEVVALHKRGPWDLWVVWRLVRLMRARQVALVHTHLWGANLWGRLAACLARVPVIIATEHSHDTWKGHMHFLLDRVLARWTRRLVAVSHPVREFYEAHGIGRGRWQIIHNGVEPGPAPQRTRDGRYKALGVGRDEPVVGFVGRLVSARAPGVFVEAVARARHHIPSLRALIVGEGPLRQEVELQVHRLGLERRVTLLGMRQDVPEWLAGLDALVFCSEREGCSLAMLEAMAMGVPVVATQVGGTLEVIESEVSGLLVPPRQPQALADRIVELLNSPAKAAAIRTAARQRVEQHFSLRRMIEEHERLYLSRDKMSSSIPSIPSVPSVWSAQP
jgi:glycosyltransferase involved in cell wall biosynthesis